MRLQTTLLLLLATAFAGCAEEATAPADDGPTLDVDDKTGGIRGVVVDQTINPVAGATVTLLPDLGSTETAEDGTFTFSGLDPGSYFLSVTRLLHAPVQTSVDVVAGVADPEIVRIQITRLTDASPYIETVPFDGFYECAFAYFFITDSCDMATRTIHDFGVEPVPRHLQNNVNTAFHTFSDSTLTIIQEAFWNPSSTPELWIMVDSTPIDNGCDCSQYNYAGTEGTSPLYARSERPEQVNAPANWPTDGEDVAIRGFIPFTDGATTVHHALGVDFQIFTSFFHHYSPPEGWNLQDKDQYPVPE